MLKEQLVLAAALESREAYDAISKYADAGTDFGPLAGVLYGAIGSYYKDDDSARRCNRELIASRVSRGFQNPKHASAFEQFLGELPSDASAVAVVEELRALREQRVAGKLALACANGSPRTEVEKLIREYQSCAVLGKSESGPSELLDVFDTTDLETEEPKSARIKLWPKSLHAATGGALRGHHVLIFARPETGKTLFSVNLCAGFLHQKLGVLYVGNEEPAADIRERVRSRLLKVTRNDLRSNRADALRRLATAGLGTLSILETTNFQDVRGALQSQMENTVSAEQFPRAQQRCSVVVLDQVRNMRLKSDSRTAELEASGIEARAIAKEFNVLVVSVTQAGDSATNKVYLEMSDVDSSKTGLPASADLMIGLGNDSGMRASSMIGVSLCKNKLSGEHARFTCTADYSTGIIE